MNDLVPFLLALRKLDANLQAEVGLDERFQHVRDLAEADARLMVRICERHAQAGMLVALDPSDMQLPPDERAAEVLRVYRSMCARPTPADAAQAVKEAVREQQSLPRLRIVHSGDGATLRRDGDEALHLNSEAAGVTYADGKRIDKRPGQFCHADDDGNCTWTDCPQLQDGEPAKSRRHCPLDNGEDEA